MDKNNNDTANFMFIISFAGLLVKLIFEHTKPADASIWGYGISAAAILVIMVIILANQTALVSLDNFKIDIFS